MYHNVANKVIVLVAAEKLPVRILDPAGNKDWKYINIDELEKLLDACPNWGWKMLNALCHFAGLSRGEALKLQWSDIDWQKHRIIVIAEKNWPTKNYTYRTKALQTAS